VIASGRLEGGRRPVQTHCAGGRILWVADDIGWIQDPALESPRIDALPHETLWVRDERACVVSILTHVGTQDEPWLLTVASDLNDMRA